MGQRFQILTQRMNERQIREFAGVEAEVFRGGGIALVAKAAALSVNTVWRGLAELDEAAGDLPSRRIRKTGGGRKSLFAKDPGLVDALEGLVEPFNWDDPMRLLRRTCRSVRRLAAELNAQGHQISATKVADLLAECGYSLQSHRNCVPTVAALQRFRECRSRLVDGIAWHLSPHPLVSTLQVARHDSSSQHLTKPCWGR